MNKAFVEKILLLTPTLTFTRTLTTVMLKIQNLLNLMARETRMIKPLKVKILAINLEVTVPLVVTITFKKK